MIYDPAKVICNPGRLIVGPTNLTAASAPYYGGTQLGYVTKAKLVKRVERAFADSEARGRSGVQTYRGMSGASLIFVLSQNDPNVLNKTWANDQTSAQGFSRANRLFLPQVGLNVGPGLVPPDSELLFVADDPAHPSLLVYSPSWIEPEELSEIDLVLDKAYEFPMGAIVGLDSTNRDMASDLLENLSL